MNPLLTLFPASDPAPILRYRDSLHAADLLTAAMAHLDFFTWLNENPGVTAQEICVQLRLAERPLDVLLTLCRANGLVETSGNGANRLTTVAKEHLVRSSPWFLGPYYDGLKERPVVREFVEVLRTGKPATFAANRTEEDWHKAMLKEDFAREFTAAMDCRGLALGQALARALAPHFGNRSRVLDIGGGSGIYAATMLAAHPHLTATVLEQTPVDAIARRAIENYGLSNRIEVVNADIFRDAWPAADVHLFSNVLHDWDFPRVRQLLQRSADFLPAGGLLVIHEVFVADDKSGPLAAAEYSALLMHACQGKCYSRAEYGGMLREIGFKLGPAEETIGGRGFMTAMRVSETGQH